MVLSRRGNAAGPAVLIIQRVIAPRFEKSYQTAQK